MNGALAAGIPGEPAALAHLAENYGRLPLRRSLQAAIRLAREGFAVDEHYRRMARFRLPVLRASTAASAQFLVDGAIPELGYKIRQPELADTLERLARQGRAGFYAGETARLLVDAVRSAGGVWSLRDLAEYQVIERAPVRGHYRGWSVVSAAPPSSGGVVLLEMLNMLSGYALNELQAPARTHLLVEVMRRAYRDRAAYLGDPDFVAMPLRRLLSEDYAAGLMRSFDPQRASASDAAKKASPEGRDTTHFSILDRAGNRVAATLSINYPFGSGFVAAGTGVLLNDEMDDFSARPGVPNAYGLVGGQANAIAPGKRMLSSMSPTFVESERGVAILGTPGGSRIISMLLLGVLSLEQGGTASDWVERPRFHHQYLPDRIQYEPGAFDAETVQALSDLGHDLEPLQRSYGDMQAVYWNLQDDAVTAASDPRGVGSAQVR
jgi:gamma-glutamyltranspeptidase/glutathione hydrolase